MVEGTSLSGRTQDRHLPVNHTDQLEKISKLPKGQTGVERTEKKQKNKWVKIVRKYLMEGWMYCKMKKHHKLQIKCLSGGYYLIWIEKVKSMSSVTMCRSLHLNDGRSEEQFKGALSIKFQRRFIGPLSTG